MVEVNQRSRKRVRRRTSNGPFLNMSIARHFWNMLVVAVIGSVGIAFLLVYRHEDRAHVDTTTILSKDEDSPTTQKDVGENSPRRLVLEKKPFMLYGTAWKEHKTASLVAEAMHAGFRFIDTAGQPKHYREAGVGEGWTRAAKELQLDRSDLWLQTKYSPHQDTNAPYDTDAALPVQVQQSVESSLKNLQTDYIDSLVLHSPLRTMEDTLTVWQAMEAFVDQGKVKYLGISNCYSLEKFTTLYKAARHKPFALQNRFYAESNFDTELRQFCKNNNVLYQSFWTLTANGKALKHPDIKQMAHEKHLTPQTLLFAFLMSLGYATPLSGTTSAKHMEQDVGVMRRVQAGEVFFETEDELRKMAQLLGMPDL